MKTLPPNQALAAVGKWPVVGEKEPLVWDGDWRIAVEGCVKKPKGWSLEELREAVSWREFSLDIHCVTRWSRLGVRFGGFLLADLLELCVPMKRARFVSFVSHSPRSHSTSLLLKDALALRTLVALTHEGEPLDTIHGGPVRTVVPGRYFYKSLKWLKTIRLLEEDVLGYWEQEAGYHNHADPWKEERYVLTNRSRKEVLALFQMRDIRERDLLSLEANQVSLQKLRAEGALLRNAKFQGTDLRGASFAGANLSNASFCGADLREVNFRGADVEGADFCGADLRGADFRDASLFGASFCPEDGWLGKESATLDASTYFEERSLEALSDTQRAFLRLKSREE